MQSITSVSSPLAASSRFYKLCAQILQPTVRRHQSSYRRARSKLNIKPDASFLPSRTDQHDHIIYNPPPSMPNVHHTPNIFLPSNDRRKIKTPAAAQVPPPLPNQTEKRYHVTADEMAEMRELRKEDPVTWSVKKLSKKYDCSPLLVSFVTEKLGREKKQQQEAVTAMVKSRWGTKRRVAREDRQLRKETWYRDA